jgi:hypothetical protein
VCGVEWPSQVDLFGSVGLKKGSSLDDRGWERAGSVWIWSVKGWLIWYKNVQQCSNVPSKQTSGASSALTIRTSIACSNYSLEPLLSFQRYTLLAISTLNPNLTSDAYTKHSLQSLTLHTPMVPSIT